MTTFPVTVAAVDRIGFQGPALSCTVITTTGSRTFEAHHESFAAVLAPGTVRVVAEDGSPHAIATGEGIVQCDGNRGILHVLVSRILDKS